MLSHDLIKCFTEVCVFLHEQNIENLDLVVADHNSFGKGFIKTCKVCHYFCNNFALNIM